jgi:hypothetical protein
VPAIEPYDMLAERHFIDNNLWLELDQPGLGPVSVPAPVLGPADDRTPAPQLGEHNDQTELWRALQPAGD